MGGAGPRQGRGANWRSPRQSPRIKRGQHVRHGKSLGGHLLALLQLVQRVGGLLGVGGGGEDGAFVLLQDLQPVRQIGGVVFADLRGDAQVSAQESGSQLGDQFLEGVGIVPEALAKFAGIAALVAGPVNQLVGLGRGVALGILERLGLGSWM